MKNEIEAMITDITATTAEAEDYTGEDGLLYCGKCHTPKEAYFPKETAQWLGHDRRPDCVTEIRMGNSVLTVSGFFKQGATDTAADKMMKVLEAEAATQKTAI